MQAKYSLLLVGALALPFAVPAQTEPVPPAIPAPAPAPEAPPDAIAALAATGDHARLLEAIEVGGLASSLRALSPVTVFAPTDSAFASATDEADLEDLLRPVNHARLGQLLRYHIVAGRLDTATIDARLAEGGGSTQLTTLQGSLLTLTREGGDYLLADTTGHRARLSRRDLAQRGGVVHAIDAVMVPHF